MALKVGDPVPRALAQATVQDRAGEPTALHTLWSRGPALILFLRHFGCIGCAEQVTELSPRMDELRDAGVRTVLVGNGAPEMIDAFVARHGLSDKACELVTDPSLSAFRAAELVRSAWATIGARAIVDMARAFGKGHGHPGLEGDRWQQGGALLVDAGGRVVVYHRNRSLGDHLHASELVDAALALLVRKSAMHV
jgi:peroxiredoxin